MLITSTIFSVGAQADREFDPRVGERYDIERKRLIGRGFFPIAQEPSLQRSCDLYADICEAYPEVMFCASDLFAPCLMQWKNKMNEVFVIRTRGELLNDLKIDGMFGYPKCSSLPHDGRPAFCRK